MPWVKQLDEYLQGLEPAAHQPFQLVPAQWITWSMVDKNSLILHAVPEHVTGDWMDRIKE